MGMWESFKSAIATVFNRKPNPPTEMQYEGMAKILPEGSEKVGEILARGHVIGNYFYVVASAACSIIAMVTLYQIFNLIFG